jgi:hypothetical protein
MIKLRSVTAMALSSFLVAGTALSLATWACNITIATITVERCTSCSHQLATTA